MSVTVRKAAASATIASKKVEVQQVQVSMAINRPARVDITHHTANDAATAATNCVTADIIAGARAAQEAMFKPDSAGNCSVQLSDGAGGTWQFSGLLTRPNVNLLNGRAGAQDTAIQRVGYLSTAKTSIYTYSALADEMQVGPDGTRKLSTIADVNLTSTDIATHLKDVLQALMLAWDANALNTDEVSKTLEAQVHSQNLKALPLWYEILDSSTSSTILPLMAADASMQTIMRNINQNIAELYLQPRDDFFDLLRAICATFQLVYIPGESTTQSAGRLIRASEVLTYDGSSRSLPIELLNIDGGPARLVPITQVIGRGAGTSLFKQSPTSTTRVQAYPESPKGGGFGEVSLPPWLSYPFDAGLQVKTLDYQESGTGTPDLTSYQKKRDEAQKTFVTLIDEGVRAVVDDWLRNHYIDISLGQSISVIKIPLDVTWEVGTRYRITAAGNTDAKIADTFLFEGFLTDVTHDMMCGEGAPAPCTTLSFSHTEVGGFELPNK